MPLFERGQSSVGRFAAFSFLMFVVFSGFSAALSVMHAPAVDANGQGILTTIQAEVRPGSGGVYLDIQPFISVETQNSAKVAAQQAAKLATVDLSKFDVFYKIVANTDSVDGPSGGQAMALLAYAEFTHKTIRNDLTVTGTIEADGSIGQVGGILEKIQAAQQSGIKLVLLPVGQAVQNGVDLTQYAKDRFGMQVVEVKNLTEAVALAFTPIGSSVSAPAHPELPLHLDNVTALQTDSVLPLEYLAQHQVQKLQTKLMVLDANSVIAQVVRQAINRSSYLLSNGYYYSAANEAFLAQIQADSYSNSNLSKAELIQRVQQLQKDMDAYAFAEPNAANLEWSAGARLRYFWAKERLQTVLGASAAAQSAVPLLDDYEASVGWFSASQQLDAQAKTQGGTPVAMDTWKAYAYQQILQANASLAKDPLDSEALFHLHAGERALDSADYLAASYDAGFALAFDQARTDLAGIKGSQRADLLPVVDDLKNYSNSAWSELYLVHGLYSASRANQSGDLIDAVDAVKLADLADALNQVHSDLLDRIGKPIEPYTGPTISIPSSSSTKNGVSVTTTVEPSGLNPLWFLLAAAVLVALVLVLLILSYGRRPKELNRAERLDLLDRGLLEGRISEKTYLALGRKYGADQSRKTRRKK